MMDDHSYPQRLHGSQADEPQAHQQIVIFNFGQEMHNLGLNCTFHNHKISRLVHPTKKKVKTPTKCLSFFGLTHSYNNMHAFD